MKHAMSVCSRGASSHVWGERQDMLPESTLVNISANEVLGHT